MRYARTLEQGTLIRRYKRFLADVELDGRSFTAHIANTGSMRNCLADRAPVRLWNSQSPTRKLPWSVEQIQVDGHWIVVNTARPNKVVEEALIGGTTALGEWGVVQREKTPDGLKSRFDFRLQRDQEEAWVEVKNATMREGDIIRFPDAVTQRGRRHLDELASLVRPGRRAVLLFHVGHEGGRAVQPADAIDPDYGRALRGAVKAGVEVYAYRCVIAAESLTLGEAMPIEL